jgi:hypothetical protein
VKREAGEIPARSRHCNQRADGICHCSFGEREGAGFAMTCESGDLPGARYVRPLRGKRTVAILLSAPEPVRAIFVRRRGLSVVLTVIFGRAPSGKTKFAPFSCAGSRQVTYIATARIECATALVLPAHRSRRAHARPRIPLLRNRSDARRGHPKFSSARPARCARGRLHLRPVLAVYAHLHFRSSPVLAARFVEACRRYRAISEPETQCQD